jgi:hypothetical protein
VGLITFNGQLLEGDGGLAASKKCCCKSRSKYCVVRTVLYRPVSRFIIDLADPEYVPPPVNGFVWPEGKPCDPYCDNGTAFGYFENDKACGCGGDPAEGGGGNAWNVEVIDRLLYNDPAALARRCPELNPPAFGPGTELKKLLSWVGIRATEGCQCDDRALLMDIMGADEVEERLSEVVGWLEEEAADRGLPFVRTVAELAVKQAIRNSRRKEPEPGADES